MRFCVSGANLAMTLPWKGSVKQAREDVVPISVTFSLVEEGETIGTFAACAFGAMKSDRVEATSPSSATTCSLEIRRVAAVAASSGLPSSGMD